MKMKSFLSAVVLLAQPFLAAAQTVTYETNVLVQTIAGSGFFGYLDGKGTQTMFNGPDGLTADSKGNVFVWDSLNYRIRRISPDGDVITFAGSGRQGSADGVGTNASFYGAGGGSLNLVVDKSDNIYFPDWGTIRQISPQGVVTTFAGRLGAQGYLDGPRTNAQFGYLACGLAFDLQGNLLVADAGNHRIRRISADGIVTTIAGSGNGGAQNGNGIFTSFGYPRGIAVDPAGNIFVGDTGNYLIRKITPAGDVTTFAGTVGQYGYQEGIGTNAILRFLNILVADELGNLYVPDQSIIRKVTPEGRVTALAGSYTNPGYADGEGSMARFGVPAIAIDQSGNLFAADYSNHRIRKISYEPVPTAAFNIDMYAGLSISGLIGRSYRIEYSDSLSNSPAWTSATTITLTSSPFVWFDGDSINAPKRFYRAILLP
ncbi:MAG: hypothetical protein AAB676_02585 [Verrucomicrobiota bacterium]